MGRVHGVVVPLRRLGKQSHVFVSVLRVLRARGSGMSCLSVVLAFACQIGSRGWWGDTYGLVPYLVKVLESSQTVRQSGAFGVVP